MRQDGGQSLKQLDKLLECPTLNAAVPKPDSLTVFNLISLPEPPDLRTGLTQASSRAQECLGVVLDLGGEEGEAEKRATSKNLLPLFCLCPFLLLAHHLMVAWRAASP